MDLIGMNNMCYTPNVGIDYKHKNVHNQFFDELVLYSPL